MLLSLLSKRSLHADSRDSYGFNVRPQHLHRYREYANIYKEEEEERLNKWKSFLENQAESTSTHNSNKENISKPVISQVIEQQSEPAKEDSSTEQGPEGFEQSTKTTEPVEDLSRRVGDSSEKQSVSDTHVESAQYAKSREVQTWAKISPSLDCIENMMSIRAKRKIMKDEKMRLKRSNLPSIDEAREESAVDEDVFYDNEITDDRTNVESCASDKLSEEPFFPWKQELEFLVHGGIPKDLRGEVWQAFVGIRTRRVEKYYQYLLATEIDASDVKEHDKLLSGDGRTQHNEKKFEVPEKWRKQIEKDLPRTFPGHPALNENGRNSLRRVLLAYARHNPSVGYCQAMNFFAGLLLLMMPEENAFWTLVGIIDDYFEGYFSQEMIESQVDQLVLEDLMRERFPKLVNHLDYLGVQVAWLSGPWFLSIFLNMIPWESALRVWDVLLYEGNRVMLFRTALALMDLYGPAVVTTKDAGDAITLLQTLAGSTFDSSQLVLTACMGFLTVTEERLQVLREKHRPAIVAAVEERTKGAPVSKDPKGLATKLYSFKRDRESIKEKKTRTESSDSISVDEISDIESANMEEFVKGMTESEVDSLPELQDQVVWLKVELSRLMEDKRSAILRAEELEAALMEMVKQDNRRELSARVEGLEQEVAQLRQALADKKEGENAMLQVLMKVEQEQRVTEDARRFAEQDAAAQRYAVNVLEESLNSSGLNKQEKYEKAMTSLAQMEKRAIMAESMLQATLEYESGQSKALASPRFGPAGSQAEPRKSGLLSFGLGWRDRNKAKSGKEETGKNDESVASDVDDHANGQKG